MSTTIATRTPKSLDERFFHEEVDSTEVLILGFLTGFAILISLEGKVYHSFHDEKLCLLLYLNNVASTEMELQDKAADWYLCYLKHLNRGKCAWCWTSIIIGVFFLI